MRNAMQCSHQTLHTLHRTCSWMRPKPCTAIIACIASPTLASDATMPSSGVLSNPNWYSRNICRGAASCLQSTSVRSGRSAPMQKRAKEICTARPQVICSVREHICDQLQGLGRAMVHKGGLHSTSMKTCRTCDSCRKHTCQGSAGLKRSA